MRFCPNCGTPFNPGISHCQSCGNLLPLDRISQSGVQQPKETLASYPPLPAENGSQQPGNNAYYASAMSPAHNSSPGLLAANMPARGGALYEPPPPPPPPGNTGGYGMVPTVPPGTGQQPAYRKNKLSRGTVLALGLLAVFIMGAGLWLIYYTTVSHPAELHARATAVIQASSTARTRATATIQAQATGTAQVTVTAQARATVQAQATATVLQNLYTRSTTGTPALNSALSNQDNANWDVYDAVGGGGCAFSGGALHASVMQKNFYVPCFATNSNFKNFALQVQMTIVKGDEGGLIFRANQTASQFYIFRVGQDGSYSLYVSKDDKTSTAILDDSSPAIKKGTGQTNLLTVIARGNDIYLYVNKQYVSSINDPTYTSGSVGIFASNLSSGTDVAFNNAQVWAL